MYQKIVDFIRSESVRQSNLEIDLDGEVPIEVVKSLKAELRKKHDLQFKVTKQDAVSKQVYDIERESRKNQIREVIELIGEIPRYSIGTEIKEKDNGISLDKLIADVIKLPNMRVADEDLEAADTDFKVLKEYTNLRNELIRKCTAIKLAESQLQEKQYQAKVIESLFHAISESTTSEVPTYFESYHEKLSLALQESRYLWEEAVKSQDSNPSKRPKLQQRMD